LLSGFDSIRLRKVHTLFLISLSVVIAFASISSVQASENAQAARLLAVAGDGFRIHRTDHFFVVSDSDDDSVQALSYRLESTYQAVERFCEAMKLPIRPPPGRLPVIHFNRYSQFQRYSRAIGFEDASAPGFYHLQNNTIAFCNLPDFPPLQEISRRIEQAEAQRDPSVAPEQIGEWRSQRDALVETFNRLVIQHEAAHQILFNVGVLSRDADNPDWLVEGLACQFEVSAPQALNQMRLADFREALGVAVNAVDIDETTLRYAFTTGRFLSLADLFTDRMFNAPDEHTRKFRYAQAWGLVYYLHSDHGNALAAYLRRITAPASPGGIYEFEAVFGPTELPTLHGPGWIDALLRLPFEPISPSR